MSAPSMRCTCSGGNDTCVQVGQCVTFCATMEAAKAAANALVLDCDPTSAARQCPTGLECKSALACKKLDCGPTGLYAKPCYGLCMPADRSMVVAQLSDDGRQIKVALNAAAAPGGFACLSAFNATSIGQDAW